MQSRCPLRFGNISMNDSCVTKECAWYNEASEECAIHNLNYIAEAVEKLNKKK